MPTTAGPNIITAQPPTSELAALIAEADDLSAWVGEPILWHEGEASADELAPGRMRGQALLQARLEASLGLERPSLGFRRRYGFPLGLSRMTASDPVRLADGTELAEHQIEVLEALQAAIVGRLEDQPDPDRLAPTSADPNADQRMWLEHATGSGKTVVAAAIADAARTGSVLILTSRSVLVDQFRSELTTRGYGNRLATLDDPALEDHQNPICVSTYQYWTRSFSEYDPELFSVVICDEAHTMLGDRTANAIRAFEDVPVIGMTATGTLLDKTVTELFGKQVSSFDLRQAAQTGVIVPLRALRVPPAIGMDTLEGVRQRAGDFDPDQLAELLDRDPLNYGCARLYQETFGQRSGIIYAAGVRHAERLAVSFLSAGVSATAVSGQTPRAELARILADYEAGKLRVIINSALLVEGWNSPRAEVCLHLAPTASRRVYQQRVGRVTRRAEHKSAGIVVDFVVPSYPNSGRVVTLHSLLDCDEYGSGEAVTIGPSGWVADPEPPVIWDPLAVVPVTDDSARRRQVLTRRWAHVSTELLSTADRLTWAQAAGAGAQSVGHLRRALERLASEDPGLTVSCLVAAVQNSRADCQQLAVDRLAVMASEDGQAWQAMCDLAEKTDQATLHRRLAVKAISLAAEGVAEEIPGAHGTLLEMARAERPIFERVARRLTAVTRAVGTRRLPDEPSDVEELVVRAMYADKPDAIALLIALPTGRPRSEAVILEAAVQLCPAPSDFAEQIQEARRRA